MQKTALKNVNFLKIPDKLNIYKRYTPILQHSNREQLVLQIIKNMNMGDFWVEFIKKKRLIIINFLKVIICARLFYF